MDPTPIVTGMARSRRMQETLQNWLRSSEAQHLRSETCPDCRGAGCEFRM